MNVIQTMEAIQHVKGNNHYFQLYVYVKLVVLTLKNIFGKTAKNTNSSWQVRICLNYKWNTNKIEK